MEKARNQLFEINSTIVQNIVTRQAATMILNKQKEYVLEMSSTGLLTTTDAEQFFESILHDLNRIEKIRQLEFRLVLSRTHSLILILNDLWSRANLRSTRERRKHQDAEQTNMCNPLSSGFRSRSPSGSSRSGSSILADIELGSRSADSC